MRLTGTLVPAVVLWTMLLGAPLPASHGAIMIGDYFPLVSGHVWNYVGAVNGTVPATAMIQTVDGGQIHSTATTRVDFLTSIPGESVNRRFFSLTSEGISLHREEYNAAGDDFDQWDAPLNNVPAMVDLNQTYMDFQTYQGQDPDETWTGSTDIAIQIIGFEDITTPAGTFNTLKLTLESEYDEIGVGYTASGTRIGTWWLAPGIGRVRMDETFEDFENGVSEGQVTFSFSLTDTTVPEPAGSMILVVTGGLVLASRYRTNIRR